MNLDLTAQDDLAPQNRADFCQPTTYCAWNSSNNSCACKPNSGCDDQVCSYATKDIDCPINGCYGFNIHMPDAFETGAQTPPAPILYSDADPYFQTGNVKFVTSSVNVAGACLYTTPPTSPQLNLKDKLPRR